MTIAKAKGVSSAAHAANLASYIDSDKAILREGIYLLDEGKWAQEMGRTREVNGHDRAARDGASNTVMYHQIIAFNPDECALNGHGGLTPEQCMEYAREFVSREYPNQEAILVLHREHCSKDGTDRYAVHAAVNRTDLDTGRRYNAGLPKVAQARRAEIKQDLDRRYGLAPVERGRANSKDHAMQPSKVEREMASRGVKTAKQEVREKFQAAAPKVWREGGGNRAKSLAQELAAQGVRMGRAADRKDFTYSLRGYKFKGAKLGRSYSQEGFSALMKRGDEAQVKAGHREIQARNSARNQGIER